MGGGHVDVAQGDVAQGEVPMGVQGGIHTATGVAVVVVACPPCGSGSSGHSVASSERCLFVMPLCVIRIASAIKQPRSRKARTEIARKLKKFRRLLSRLNLRLRRRLIRRRLSSRAAWKECCKPTKHQPLQKQDLENRCCEHHLPCQSD